jgi:tetratricopeptide (TPR) repeat protein
MKVFLACWIIVGPVVALAASLSISGSASRNAPSSTLDRIQIAMETTNSIQQNPSNVTLLYVACDQWDQVMQDSNEQLKPQVRAICSSLQASCLARIGQDDRASVAYDECLSLQRYISNETFQDAILGKDLALQRGMRYDEARDTFLQIRNVSRAAVGAATCCLRLGDDERAEKILRLNDFSKGHKVDLEVEVRGMLGTLMYLRNNSKDACTALGSSGGQVSSLSRWIAQKLGQPQKGERTKRHAVDFLELAAVNQSPFDDPFLIHLDDKVLLHKLLVSESKQAPSYWPEGFVLPQEVQALKQICNTKYQWILKQRAGYGSHGNRIVDANQAVQLCSTMTTECLLQRMVDPPMLLQRRKFSLRLYVVCLGDTPYLAKNGLVKLASIPYSDKKTSNSDAAMMNDRMHMTNSGREDAMSQYDFCFLQRELEQQGYSYDKVWLRLREAVSTLMQMYYDHAATTQSTYRSRLKLLGIPKILGLDFMIKADGIPQLLEVNRFPGLEPRGDGDRDVKVSVVYGSWGLAAGRANCDLKGLGLLPDDMDALKPDLFEELTL